MRNQAIQTSGDNISLVDNAAFVRISANYSQRGYGDENPITLDAYSLEDFSIIIEDSVRILNIEETTSELTSFISDELVGKDSSWTTKNITSTHLLPGNVYEINLVGPITFAGTSEGQTFLNLQLKYTSGGYATIFTKYGRDLTFDEAKYYIEPQKEGYLYVEGRWSTSESLKIEVYKGVKARVGLLESKMTNDVITRNINKDSFVRSTGVLAVSDEIKPLSFIHMSDTHTKSDNYKCLESACKYLQHYNNIQFAIITGDIVWDTFADTMDWYDIAIKKTTKPVLNVVGNHDSGQNMGTTSLDRVSNDLQCYNKYIAPYVDKWAVTQPNDAAIEGKSYYYKDFTDEKIRLIVLCEFETDFEINPNDETQLLYSREYRAMRQEQVDWFISSLANTPSDYGVVVALHQPDTLNNEDNAFVSYGLVDRKIANVYADDKEWLLKILDAYKEKKALSFSFKQTGAVVGTINVSCDFTNVSAELICVLCGHTHNDYIGHYKSYPNLLVLVVGANNLKYTGNICQRATGTPSEDLFNVVNIDRNRKKITVIRIGADGSVYGQYRNHITVDYLSAK